MTKPHRRDDRADEALASYHQGELVTRRLTYAVFIMIILLLLVVLYGVIVGIVSPPQPRTATEARITLLEGLVEQNSTSGKAHYDYIVGLSAAGNDSDAYDALDDARVLLTGWEIAYADAAEATLLFQDEKYDEAMTAARAGYDREMDAREQYVASMKQRNLTVSITDISIEPLMTMLIYEARAAGAIGDWQRAIDALSDALAIDPRAADVLTLRAAAHEEAGDSEAALADYRAALTYIPDHEPALAGVERLEGAE